MIHWMKSFAWLAPTKSDFLSRFSGDGTDSELYRRAEQLWAALDERALWCLVALIIFAIASALYYYFWFNKKPGRHWRPKYWLVFLAVEVGLAALVTFGIIATAKPAVSGLTALAMRVALCAAIYAALVYWLCSVVIRHTRKTNAYYPCYIP